MTTVFHSVGRYEIHDEIGRGGMAVVFRATDTQTNRQVALKLVSIERDRDGQQVLEAEQWGAKLQEEFCRASRYVPTVFEHGTHGKYFFIAMEHLPGRNLSEVIGEGPLPAERAVRVAIQLCEFLEDAAKFEGTLDGRTFNLLLHGDLKPRNIRVLDDDEIKVFDFGIAKALSLSRKVTRNDFGSIAYLSPERLESGEIDAQAELWAVGVLLYEMVGGVQPFRAPDTRRLEQRIRARERPVALDNGCPAGLKAIIAKLLAPAVADRYRSAVEIRDDLLRFSAGGEVVALREGWPDRQRDEGATRRTERPAPIAQIEEVTRRTVREALPSALAPAAPVPAAPAPVATAAVMPARAVQPAVAAPVPASAVPVSTPAVARPRRRGRVRRFLRKALVAIALIMVLNEIRVYVIAAALAPNVPQETGGLIQMWEQYANLNDSSSLNLGAAPLRRALTRQTSALAERIFERYRTAGGTVFEREWRQTREALTLAILANQAGGRLEAAMRYCEGHLRRIDGETRIRAKQGATAVQDLTSAVSAFRRAAELRSDWPDPFLGLMRTFIAMEDIERGADALAQAERYGYTAGNRDWALLGEGYLARGAKLAATEEIEPLNRAADAYTQAIDHFTKAAGYGNVAQRLREARRRLAEVRERLLHLTDPVDRDIASRFDAARLAWWAA
jgi:tRNA A-37 threonylcarbamoyl transferase component Bud32/tetratricopeptide (TPR) repeat protein